jgi:hypothetical protein
VEGCLAWQREGLGVPPIIEAATAQYRADQDPLREFFEQCCIFEEEAWVASAALYAVYQGWARENGIRQDRLLTSTAVGLRLRARGCVKKPGEITDDLGKRKKARGWLGLRLRTEADPEGDDSPTGGPPSSQDNRTTGDEAPDSTTVGKTTTSSTTEDDKHDSFTTETRNSITPDNETINSTAGDETADSTANEKNEPSPDGDLGSADGRLDTYSEQEPEPVQTGPPGSLPPSRARQSNEWEEPVPTGNQFEWEPPAPTPSCPLCGSPRWTVTHDRAWGHCARCGPVRYRDRIPGEEG